MSSVMKLTREGTIKEGKAYNGRQYKQCSHCNAWVRNTRVHIHARRCAVLHPKPPQPLKRKKAKTPRAQRNHPPIIPDPRDRKVVVQAKAKKKLKPESRLIVADVNKVSDLRRIPPLKISKYDLERGI